ncbi:hypothetical protein TNIN_343411, partial [Trichonephila inaurata madagascariensis]
MCMEALSGQEEAHINANPIARPQYGNVNRNSNTAFAANGYVFPFDMSGEKGMVGPSMAPAPKETAGDSESLGEAEGKAQGGTYMPDYQLLGDANPNSAVGSFTAALRSEIEAAAVVIQLYFHLIIQPALLRNQ